jgi:PKD repeat protein
MTLGALIATISSPVYSQIHKVKISELKEKFLDESPRKGEKVNYQTLKVTRLVSTNSPGTVVGYTWNEYQNNGALPKMIAVDAFKGIHFTWMNGLQDNPYDNRHVDYNYLDSSGSWLGALHVTPTGAAGAATGISGIVQDHQEVLCFHQRGKRPGDTIPWASALAIEKPSGGVGSFYLYDLPDSLQGARYRGMWPQAATDSLGHIHAVMRSGWPGTAAEISPLGYLRCVIDDSVLICETPGLDPVEIPPDTLISYPNTPLAAIFDSSLAWPIVTSSPVSKKVAVIYVKYPGHGHTYLGDICYIESSNCGQEWIDGGSFQGIEKHNITNYTVDDTIRAHVDLSAIYDYDDNLHILWTTPGYWESQGLLTLNACFLWHWSQATGLTLVADGWRPSNPGGWNLTISKMSIGVSPTTNYLYAAWTQFDNQDTAANGYSNGEIYASASKDGGLTWDVPRNLTNSRTPGCQAGECESDHWPSLAEIVKDTLHVQYINDKDAGSAVFGEGRYTNNPVLYLKVSAWTPTIFPVSARFSSSPRAGFKPLTVQFVDASTGDPISWHWDFGDGDSSTLQNPVHIYSDTGHYDIKLTVTNPTDADTVVYRNYVAVFDTLTINDLSAEPPQGHKPLTVSFQAYFNVMPESLTWYFGDGQISHLLNPVHTFSNAGFYDVKLVAEIFGYRDSVTKEDYIKVSDIKVQFASDKRCGSAPLTVNFSDSSTGTYPITNWHWDFGDGDTSNSQRPAHQFEDSTVFDITLIVSDGIASDSMTKKGYITTQYRISPDFIGLPIRGRSPLTVMFEPRLAGIANHYLWDFGEPGDSDTSSLRNPIHTYTTQGKYDVKLKARLELDECNQEDSVIKQCYVVVNDLIAKFSANPAAGIEPLTVQFTDESEGYPDGWFWRFGDGYTSTAKNPSHQYSRAGQYDVFLRVINVSGSDSLYKLKYILVDTAYVDLLLDIYSPGARPGFGLWYYPVILVKSTIPAENCTLKVSLPPEMEFDTVYPGDFGRVTCSGYSLSGNTVKIPLGTITSGDIFAGYVGIYGTLSPDVPLGDTLLCEAWITSSVPDRNSEDNHLIHQQMVVGSIDPNDKLAYPEGVGSSKAIGPNQSLAYTIQFENKAEATAEAIYIRVVDTLDHNLDWGTLAIGPSSHPDKCDYEFNPYTGEIVWFCDSIMLPPNLNPPEGEGYFTYSISPKKNLFNGTEIKNKAWIRFDYNDWLQAPQEGPVVRTIAYSFMRGDANGDGKWTVADAVYLINYLFKGGPTPIPLQAGDCNCDGKVSVADVVYLINYLFKGGPAPNC